jgi:hypothetical protein
MNTKQIHLELLLVVSAIEFAEETQKEKESGSISALYNLLLAVCKSHAIVAICTIQDNEKFCKRCFYDNIDTVRKAVYRYISLEQDAGDISVLIKANDAFNKICISLKNYKDADCCQTRNDAWDSFNK